jgi:hypothetical protein
VQGFSRVAVGILVIWHPLHRSGFPHRALALGFDAYAQQIHEALAELANFKLKRRAKRRR